jgi:hypothetical protein
MKDLHLTTAARDAIDPMACAVRIRFPDSPAASGLMVLPDLVLTCRHAIQPLLDMGRTRDQAWMTSYLANVAVLVPGTARQGLVVDYPRQLDLSGYVFEGDDPDSAPWLLRPGDPSVAMPGNATGDFADCMVKQLDFAFVRLAGAANPDPRFWPLAGGLQSLKKATGLAVRLRHFPTEGDTTRVPEERTDLGQITGTVLHNGFSCYTHAGAETQVGSSGAVLFAEPGEGMTPYPLALHCGVLNGEQIAVPIASILETIGRCPNGPHLVGELTEGRDLILARHRAATPAQQAAETLAGWMHRDQLAQTFCDDRFGRQARRHLAICQPGARFEDLLARLVAFDLPARADPQPGTDAAGLRLGQIRAMLRGDEAGPLAGAWAVRVIGRHRAADAPDTDDTEGNEAIRAGLMAQIAEHINFLRFAAIDPSPMILTLTHEIDGGSIADHAAFLQAFGQQVDDFARENGAETWHLAHLVTAATPEGFRDRCPGILAGVGKTPRILLADVSRADLDPWFAFVGKALERGPDDLEKARADVPADPLPLEKARSQVLPRLRDWALDRMILQMNRGTWIEEDPDA